MERPWNLELQVEELVIGKDTGPVVNALMVSHNGLPPRATHAVVFLQSDPAGHWGVVHVDPEIVRDLKGRFVKPIEGPNALTGIAGMALNSEAESWLKPIRYRPKDAWWLDRRGLVAEDDAFSGAATWRAEQGRWLVARRGLFIDDLPAMLKSGVLAGCPG